MIEAVRPLEAAGVHRRPLLLSAGGPGRPQDLLGAAGPPRLLLSSSCLSLERRATPAAIPLISAANNKEAELLLAPDIKCFGLRPYIGP